MRVWDAATGKEADLIPVDGVENVRQRLRRAAAALEEAGIPYVVIGGNAVAAWVSRVDEAAVRNTRDVDLLLRRSDLAAARCALEAAGFVHRSGAAGCRPTWRRGCSG